jgi:hypothetical protein
MGYGIMAYGIDFDMIREIVGSRDWEALERYQAHFTHDAAAIDELLQYHSPGEAEAALPTARDALRQLIAGEPLDDRVGFAYAYCLKFLCDVHGDFLDNSTWYPVSAKFLDLVQSALDGAGVSRETISILRLTGSGSPIPIPFVDDFPGIGFLAKPAVRDASLALSRVNPVAITDDDVRQSILTLTEWVAICRERSCDLICFYH